eukprot:scaffold93712_cov69-Phaeocystis_antarctica.AAC.6
MRAVAATGLSSIAPDALGPDASEDPLLVRLRRRHARGRCWLHTNASPTHVPERAPHRHGTVHCSNARHEHRSRSKQQRAGRACRAHCPWVYHKPQHRNVQRKV